MLTLSERECISLIKKGECFSASIEGGAFYLKIDEYSPIVCAAIHNGHQLRPELAKNFLLNKQEQFYEEDPYTADMVSSFPIVIQGGDSRFEYDLNRPKALSTYFKTAWSKQVWRKSLSPAQRAKSHQKHQSFYNVLEALIAKTEKMFGNTIVFDIHSYNYQRIEKDTPTFNIGSAQIDVERWGSVLNRFESQLNKIELPNLDSRAAIDEVFQGRGYLISHVNAHFDNTLVLPTEVKKVFMDETSGELYPLVLEELKTGFKQAIGETAAFFMRRFGKKKRVAIEDVLSSSISEEVIKLDNALFKLCSDIETLNFINPINIASERKRCLSRSGIKAPNFTYKQLNINPYKFRESLYKLPVDDVLDVDIQQLYRHIIDNLASKIDLLTTVGTEQFLYNSLKYYGEPNATDIANARFILHAPDISSEQNPEVFDAKYAAQFFKQQADEWKLQCKVEVSNKLVAKAMVNNHKRQLLVNRDATFTKSELVAFCYHELGVHMVTTINSQSNPLKVFRLGLAGNTHTQEGLAIFAEYCSGNLTLSRLKILALRVMAVHYMLKHNDFIQTYNTLKSEFDLDSDFAFTLTTRVYRAGGFTKDHLYLKGFRDVIQLSQQGAPISNLLIGKTGLLDFEIISEMIARGMISKPNTVFDFDNNATKDPVLDYLVSGLK